MEIKAPVKSRNELCCDLCGFTEKYCFCADFCHLETNSSFALVTHRKELLRQTNTGFLLKRCLKSCEIFPWDRLTPPQKLLNLIDCLEFRPYLLFPPNKESDKSYVIEYEPAKDTKRDLFIIIDATWQQAAKIVRKSAWLNQLPRIYLTPQTKSQYTLRRNQVKHNVCTAETAVFLLELAKEIEAAASLNTCFDLFMKRFIAAKKNQNLLPK